MSIEPFTNVSPLIRDSVTIDERRTVPLLGRQYSRSLVGAESQSRMEVVDFYSEFSCFQVVFFKENGEKRELNRSDIMFSSVDLVAGSTGHIT